MTRTGAKQADAYRYGRNTYWFLGGPLHGMILPVTLDSKGAPPTYYEMTVLARDRYGHIIEDRDGYIEVSYPYYELWGDGHYHYKGKKCPNEFIQIQDATGRRAA